MTATAPLPAFHFYITLVDAGGAAPVPALDTAPAFVLGGFSEVQGLESEIQVEERRAGGLNDRVLRFPTAAAYPNIVLTRGVGFSEDLYLWHEGFLRGEGTRRNGLIFLAGEDRRPIKAWQFENGIPVKWSGPALNASASAVAIEKLEIAHEKLVLVLSPGAARSGPTGLPGV